MTSTGMTEKVQSDTVPVVKAAARLGKGRTWAYEWARGQHHIDGLRMLRIGRDYVVSRYELAQFLGAPLEEPTPCVE